jgi:hypothetical protein
MPTIEELIQAIKDLLEHAVYNECIMAVRNARYMIHAHKEAKNG